MANSVISPIKINSQPVLCEPSVILNSLSLLASSTYSENTGHMQESSAGIVPKLYDT